MAQGDTISAKISDQVEVRFKLDYKRAQVQQLTNPGDFETINFQLDENSRGAAISGMEPFVRPHLVRVTSDDQEITVVFGFRAGALLQVFGEEPFRVGDTIDLSCYYGDASGGRIGNPTILLGHVRLTD